MYSGSQDRRDKIDRVGSHATKGHPTRGVLTISKDAPRPLPSAQKLTLAELRDERGRLAAQKARLQAQPANPERTNEMRRCDARLSELNTSILLLSEDLAERSFEGCLKDAMQECLPGHLHDKVLNRAHELRRERELTPGGVPRPHGLSGTAIGKIRKRIQG